MFHVEHSHRDTLKYFRNIRSSNQNLCTALLEQIEQLRLVLSIQFGCQVIKAYERPSATGLRHQTRLLRICETSDLDRIEAEHVQQRRVRVKSRCMLR